MTEPRFITTKGSTSLTDKPYYIGFVQHDSVMTKKETYEFLAERLAFSEANICATFRALAATLEINAAKGLITFFDKAGDKQETVFGVGDFSASEDEKRIEISDDMLVEHMRNACSVAMSELDTEADAMVNVTLADGTELTRSISFGE